MDERLQFVARRLAGEAMADCAGSSVFLARPVIRSSTAISNAALQGLTDRSRRPYRYAHQLPFQVENYILNVKHEHPSLGARKIREP
jgi:putative transposase